MSSSRRMVFAFLLNLSFAVIEGLFGVAFRSSAILADALHDAGDALAIGSAVFLESYSNKATDERYHLGYKRFSTLGSLVTASILLIGSAFVVIENVPKLWSPEKVNYKGMLVLGIIAILVNLLASRLLTHGHRHEHRNYNEKVLSLHFLEDILGWVAVIIVSLLISVTNWYFLDPLLSIGIAIFISSKTLPELLSALKLLLNAKPDGIDIQALTESILQEKDIIAISQIASFAMSEKENWVLLKLQVTNPSQSVAICDRIRQLLYQHGVQESIIEICEKG